VSTVALWEIAKPESDGHARSAGVQRTCGSDDLWGAYGLRCHPAPLRRLDGHTAAVGLSSVGQRGSMNVGYAFVPVNIETGRAHGMAR
jgi:hypothetical protein